MWVQHNVDTSVIEFYLSTSEAFKKLVKEKGLTIENSKENGICSCPNGEHYLHVNSEMVERIEFYVHEFTELIIKNIITEVVTKQINSNDKLDAEQKYLKNRAALEIVQKLSKISEEGVIW
jgi:hypothetical protein